MKTRTIGSLVFVAIVTSATVMQIREHTLSGAPPVGAHAGLTTCGSAHQGLLRASCASLRGESRGDSNINGNEPRVARLWV